MPCLHGIYLSTLYNGNLEIAIYTGHSKGTVEEELDKTQVTELVSFLQSWLEEQNNGSGAQDL